MTRPGNAVASLLALAGLRPLRPPGVRSIVGVVFGLCPPIVCAWLAENSANWELFERSGSATVAIGLMMASRRYLGRGVLELAILHARKEPQVDIVDLLEDVFTTKTGLALSGFGTIVWGWGKYLGWWSFGYLALWTLLILRDARRDFVRLREG